jgi:glycosyltransferase involved in cell wall biosynthesis
MREVGVIFDKSGKGGGIYNQSIVGAIRDDFCVETYGITRQQRNKLFNYANLYYNLSRIRGQKDVWIRTANPIVTLPFDNTRGNNIALIHHIDNNVKPAPTKMLSNVLDNIMMRNLRLVDKIVVVSQYWKEYFEALGFDKLEVIYNPFIFEDFKFSNDEVIEFKEKYRLNRKPIIYLGNCQKAKGVVEAYESLKGLDAHFVTSGAKDVDLPVNHLNLDYYEYLMLLRASSVVVTMSKFKEGWCRTAHEAMLCKTPVVGSGMGGMRELLEGGHQIICRTFSDLKDQVEYAMGDAGLGEAGYAFASQSRFTLESFKDQWVNLINDVSVISNKC